MNVSTNYTRKFFDDKEHTIVTARHLPLKESAEEVLACLKSEGVVIEDIDSLFKTLDIILRTIGIHREPEDSDQIASMRSLVGVIKLGNIFTDDEKAERFKTLLDMFQSTVKSGWKYDDRDLETIKANVKIVTKELVTYFNDIIDVLVKEFDPKNHVCVNAHFDSKDAYDDKGIFDIMLSYNTFVGDFALNIASTMVSDIGSEDTDHVNVISFTFNENAVERAKQKLGIEDDEEKEEKEGVEE